MDERDLERTLVSPQSLLAHLKPLPRATPHLALIQEKNGLQAVLRLAACTVSHYKRVAFLDSLLFLS